MAYDLRISDDSFAVTYDDLRHFYLASRLSNLRVTDVRVERVRTGPIFRWFLVVRVRRMQYNITPATICNEMDVVEKHSKRYTFLECRTCMRVPGSRQVGASEGYVVTPRRLLDNRYTEMMAIPSFAQLTEYKPFLPL